MKNLRAHLHRLVIWFNPCVSKSKPRIGHIPDSAVVDFRRDEDDEILELEHSISTYAFRKDKIVSVIVDFTLQDKYSIKYQNSFVSCLGNDFSLCFIVTLVVSKLKMSQENNLSATSQLACSNIRQRTLLAWDPLRLLRVELKLLTVGEEFSFGVHLRLHQTYIELSVSNLTLLSYPFFPPYFILQTIEN